MKKIANRNELIPLYIFFYSNLNMVNLPSYDVPNEAFAIEKSNDTTDNLAFNLLLENLARLRMDESVYIYGYRLMIYMEEVSQMSIMNQYNENNVRFIQNKPEKRNEFYFLINVSTELLIKKKILYS